MNDLDDRDPFDMSGDEMMTEYDGYDPLHDGVTCPECGDVFEEGLHCPTCGYYEANA